LLSRGKSEKVAVTTRRPATKEATRPITIARQNTASLSRRIDMPNRVLQRTLSEGRTQEIKNYDIGSQLGSGAYATVKSSVNKTTGQTVAIKIYEKYKLASSQRKNCVNREVRVLKNIRHPHIAKFYDVIETPREVYIIMELVKGHSLLHYIKQKSEKRLAEYEAIRIFKQVLSAIEYCHNMNVVHRDIKMENILLDDRLDAKLIDFGFSTWVIPSQKLKIFCGTPSYMAPEIVNKKEYYGPPADMWSLGILLYAMLCGHFPFRARTEFELYHNISKGLFTVPSHVSDGAKKLISKLLIVDPKRRITAERTAIDPSLNL
jgi:MAP/microtubule affinity-regulating kinase